MTATNPHLSDAARIKLLEKALAGLIKAIDFEGENGSIRFNPNTPWELEPLTDARAVLELSRTA